MTRSVSTGVRALDRELGGGIPSGSLVTLLAEPASQAELFLASFAAEHDTAYLSSERAPTTVTAGLRSHRGPYDDLVVTQLDHDAPVVDAIDHVDQIPENGLFVVDPVETLERASAGQYRAFLDSLRTALAQTDSVAVLHALKHDSTPSQRHRTEYASDLLLDLETDTSDDAVESRLYVPKFRGGRALTEPLDLELTDGIAVDTSRDIA